MSDNANMTVGMDIGANSIKAVALGTTKTGFSLIAAKEIPLAAISTENGFIADYGELVHGIKNIMDGDNFPSKVVATALKGPSTFVRKISIYCENTSELQETFHWIIEQYAAVDPEEMSLDFEILGEGERYRHIVVLVVGARKDTVTDFVSVLESSKVEPRIIEPEALSLARLFRAVSPSKTDTCVLIHVGSVGSIIIFLVDGKFDFYFEIKSGGQYCSTLIMEGLGVDATAAEQIKINPDSYSDPAEVKDIILNKFCNSFSIEIDKAIKFYMFRGGAMPFKIVLSGGACETYGIADTLTDKFSLPVEFLNPWKTIEVPDGLKSISSRRNRYAYNVAVGLAMSGKVY